MNPGFDKKEIETLKAECLEEGQNFVLVDDEDEFEDEGEFYHFQFIGQYEGKEVIYDAVLSTLSLHHSSLVYEEAENKVMKLYNDYVPFEDRNEKTKVNEDAEQMLMELIEEMEEEETIKVSEFVDIDPEFDYGIGIEAALNIDEINLETIEKFIEDFNSGKLKLDKTMYSFKNGFED
ncbi:MAG: hypothetical protein IPP61_18190 [Cytophagaceae bacterium]|nr:hypothetical protein [Cytophagaceae bacterium]MBL0300126.1 hypothetical protein [Cytophagaceae bacterium]MBL0327063.1 hypothetical protein [Cytophagaceae bacterium]